jgi:2-dehydro-3-deoxyphosphooctonate aldolase (KDO 8-P synthase)
MATLTLDRWNLSIGDGQPLVVIAGINVIEDLDLALNTARTLKAICADLGLPMCSRPVTTRPTAPR